MSLTWEQFAQVDIRIGTITAAAPNVKARRPAYVLSIDLGELGTRTSSAQITDHYVPDDLVGRQVACVVNFAPKRIAGVKSQVLVLGGVLADDSVVLLRPDSPVPDGRPVA
ncbi:tRNA-binding protein [Epidermidibacterium keratini]|uniref:tRNA-binding protein n=1 Tax=Epidermidibacterium keratini TaxID=1891644 RepID=A0A7L4YRZ2_9ACTN|nr:tRNA-binding protein [Epidermidibacterium keratini]QHC01733.1 tRNA-binding protein [Epidermidibacterium keratini]